jgi:hypothetical protein
MTAALIEAGVTRDAGVLLADELRLGLRGQVRRVLAPRGIDVTQRLQVKYEWAYLLLAVDPRAGTLRWCWLDRPRAAPIKEILADWALDAVVWDGAGSHRAKLLADLPTIRVRLPPYSPELNPAERVFEESAAAPKVRPTTPSPTSRPSPRPTSPASPQTPTASGGSAAGPGSPTPSTPCPPLHRHPDPEPV